jgi:hypothetical protein
MVIVGTRYTMIFLLFGFAFVVISYFKFSGWVRVCRGGSCLRVLASSVRFGFGQHMAVGKHHTSGFHDHVQLLYS